MTKHAQKTRAAPAEQDKNLYPSLRQAITLEQDMARRWLDSIQALDACAWCQDTQHPVHRADLCRHCYNIKLEISRRQRERERTRPILELRLRADPRAFDAPEYFLNVAERMRESAQKEGLALGKVPPLDSGLDVERALSDLSGAVLKKDLFNGDATMLGHSFSPDRRRLLVYLLNRILRERGRRARRNRATSSVWRFCAGSRATAHATSAPLARPG